MGAVAGWGDCDLLGCEGVLGGDVVEAVGEKEKGLVRWVVLVGVCIEMEKWSVRLSGWLMMMAYRFEMTEMTASRPCMSPPGNG